jgi:DNA-binding transcriptional regulator YdaS (Cro superfamily)
LSYVAFTQWCANATTLNVGDASQRVALIGLMEQSFQRGHYRIALRRALMLENRGHVVPSHLREWVDDALARCPKGELNRIRQRVAEWGWMLDQHSCARAQIH